MPLATDACGINTTRKARPMKHENSRTGMAVLGLTIFVLGLATVTATSLIMGFFLQVVPQVADLINTVAH